MITETPHRVRYGQHGRDSQDTPVMVMPSALSSELHRTARRDRVVKSVLHSIFSGELSGGDRLVEEELALKLGVSRTPIREALRELTNLGVVTLRPNHGAMVRAFGPKQLLEIYQLRRVLESEATRLACKSIDHEKLRKLREEMQTLLQEKDRSAAWSAKALTADQALHFTIAQASGSDRLAEEIHRCWKLARSIAEAVSNSSFTQDHAIIEHAHIIDCLLAKDAESAGKAMARHIDLRTGSALQALCPLTGRAALQELLMSQANNPAPNCTPA